MKITVDGIVALRDKRPYVRLFADPKQIGQFSIAEARNIAMDILQMAARTEADAMIHKFFSKSEFPQGANNALMVEFRNFRLDLDTETVEKSFSEPEEPEGVQ